MRVGIAADHEGYQLKGLILTRLQQGPLEVVDFGDSILNPDDDYPDFVAPLSRAVAHRELDRGVAICGSGIGACIAANKINGIRAGIVHDIYSARQSVEDDDINVICLGARLVGFCLAEELIRIFLTTEFSGKPRHRRRIAKIAELENHMETSL